MKKDLILEIGVEEVPSIYVPGILENMKAVSTKILKENELDYESAETFATPRRLVYLIKNLDEIQRERTEEIRGPLKSVAYDASGNPTKALTGFAKSKGIEIKDTVIKQAGKDDYVFVVRKRGGGQTAVLLKELLKNFILDLKFPKSMRWADTSVSFVRPIRWIMCVYGEEEIVFSVEKTTSGRYSYGHRFLAPEKIVVENTWEYFNKLREKCVIADNYERKNKIISAIKEEEKRRGVIAYSGGNLLNSVTFLVEYPVIVVGEFNEKYLKLPKEVIVESMVSHERFFPVFDDRGNIRQLFFSVSNSSEKNNGTVKAGNEKVINARLADAEFFFVEDRKTKLTDRLDSLKDVIFQKDLGNLYDKTLRIVKLAEYFAGAMKKGDNHFLKNCVDSAQLCKSDLMTHIVGEFPALQGVMGGEYAFIEGYDKDTAMGIKEHYMPRSSNDTIPSTDTGCVISMADKMDSVAGFFGVGLIPTGSQDPYALKRQAYGIIKTLIEKKWSTALWDLISCAIGNYKGIPDFNKDVGKQIVDFFKERIRTYFEDKGIRYDEIDSVFASRTEVFDAYDVYEKATAINSIRNNPEFKPIIIAFKRASSIVDDFVKKGGAVGVFKEGLIAEKEERVLFDAYSEAKERVIPLIEKKLYVPALEKIVMIKSPIDSFFDKVLVMCEDAELRDNRLALLNDIKDLFSDIVDFSKIVV